jgi:hypothetical protein
MRDERGWRGEDTSCCSYLTKALNMPSPCRLPCRCTASATNKRRLARRTTSCGKPGVSTSCSTVVTMRPPLRQGRVQISRLTRNASHAKPNFLPFSTVCLKEFGAATSVPTKSRRKRRHVLLGNTRLDYLEYDNKFLGTGCKGWNTRDCAATCGGSVDKYRIGYQYIVIA